MLRNQPLGFLLLLAAFNILLNSCQGNEDKKNSPTTVQPESDSLSNAKLDELKKIFFSIPSPMQMTELIEAKGYQFELDKLVPAANADKYVGESRQAMMLGIYGTDLGYASLFKQKQTVTEYFAASQKIARELHLDHIMNSTLIDRFDKNKDNRDSTINIFSEVYADMNDNLKEKKRYDIAALVIAGGWLEALHLTSQYTADGTEEIRQRIAEQKYSLNNLLNYLDKFGDRASINEVKADLTRLKDGFNSVAENKGKTTTGKDKSGTTIIGTTTKIVMDDATLNNVITITAELRAKYTGL